MMLDLSLLRDGEQLYSGTSSQKQIYNSKNREFFWLQFYSSMKIYNNSSSAVALVIVSEAVLYVRSFTCPGLTLRLRAD